MLAAAALALIAHAGLAAMLFGDGDGAALPDSGMSVQVTEVIFVEATVATASDTATNTPRADPVAALPSSTPAPPALAEPAAEIAVVEPVRPPQPVVKPAPVTPAPASIQPNAASHGGDSPSASRSVTAPRSASDGAAGGRAAAGPQYERRLLEALHANLVYPRLARARGEQGEARLFLLIARDGRMLEHRIDTTSGFDSLDEAALDTARRAAPLPPLPGDYPGDRLALVVPISFALR